MTNCSTVCFVAQDVLIILYVFPTVHLTNEFTYFLWFQLFHRIFFKTGNYPFWRTLSASMSRSNCHQEIKSGLGHIKGQQRPNGGSSHCGEFCLVIVFCRAPVDNSSIYDWLTELPYWNKDIYLSIVHSFVHSFIGGPCHHCQWSGKTFASTH